MRGIAVRHGLYLVRAGTHCGYGAGVGLEHEVGAQDSQPDALREHAAHPCHAGVELVGQEVAGGVTDGDDFRTCGHGGLDRLAEEIAVTASGILRHELHFGAQLRTGGHHTTYKGQDISRLQMT